MLSPLRDNPSPLLRLVCSFQKNVTSRHVSSQSHRTWVNITSCALLAGLAKRAFGWRWSWVVSHSRRAANMNAETRTLFLNVCQVPDWTQVRMMAELNMTVKHDQTADAARQLRERDHRCPCAAWPLDPASRVVGGSKVGNSFRARVPGNTQLRRAECLCQGECAAGAQAAGGPDAPVCRAYPGRGIVSACRDQR